MRKRKLLILLCVTLAAGTAIWLAIPLNRQSPHEWLDLPNGNRVSIGAVTYGTNHVVGPPLARMISRFPTRLQVLATTLLGNRATIIQKHATPKPCLVVWLEWQTNSTVTVKPDYSQYFTALLADESGFVSGADAHVSFPPWSQALESIAFEVFPRRAPRLKLCFFQHRQNTNAPCPGELFVENPVLSNHPEWEPDPLPATNRAGDLEVTLTRFHTGHGTRTTYRTLPNGNSIVEHSTQRDDGRNYSAANLEMRSLYHTNEIWQIANVEVSDATGNSVKNSSMSQGSPDQGISFMPSLWPSERAWKLDLEVKRAAGFAPDELFVFHDVSLGEVGQTNRFDWQTNFAGVRVTFFLFSRKPPPPEGSWSSDEVSVAKITHGSLPAGTHLDLVSVVTDSGQKVPSVGSQSSGTERSYRFKEIPANARTADFTFAVHQSRKVQFLVKPELP